MARRLPRKPRPASKPSALTVPSSASAPDPVTASFWNRWRLIFAVASLLLLQTILAVQSLVQENPTVDEVIHLPAGVTYWQTGSFRLYHHNPPLVKLLAALPVVFSAPVVDYKDESWVLDPPVMSAFAHHFQKINARRYFELFTRARLLMPIFALIGGLVVFVWSRRLYGPWGGLLSLSLWVFCPNVLAHARLITTDMAATSLGCLATYLFWRYLKAPSWRLAACAGIALGLAQLTKFSMLMLYGVWPLLAALRWALERDARGGYGRTVAHAFVVVVLSVVVIDLGYGFEGVGIPLGQYEFACETLTRPVPPGLRRPTVPHNSLLTRAYRYRVNRFRDTALGWLPVPLPRHYLLGFDDQKLEAEGIPRKFQHDGPPGLDGDRIDGYPVYLNGRLSQKSWWYYYLLTLVYKVPEGTSALVVGSFFVLAFSRRSRASWCDEIAVLTVPAFVLFVMSVFTNINLGLRYVLPIFPYVYISAGKLGPWVVEFPRPQWRALAGGIVGLGLTATVAAVGLIHPHYLAYFNLASGGPDRGAEHLIDSNIDWGQDLIGLWKWLATHAPGERVGIAYFGQINPRVFEKRGAAIDWFLPPPALGSLPPPTPENLTSIPSRYRGEMDTIHLEPGLYAVSVSLVKGLPWRVYDRPARVWDGDRWNPWSVWFGAFRYFDALTPVARIGHSIDVYRVSPDEAERLSKVLRRRPRS